MYLKYILGSIYETFGHLTTLTLSLGHGMWMNNHQGQLRKYDLSASPIALSCRRIFIQKFLLPSI